MQPYQHAEKDDNKFDVVSLDITEYPIKKLKEIMLFI